MNAAIVCAARSLSEGRVRAVLPPDHRIVATRPGKRDHMIEYLVEGPMLPEITPERPAQYREVIMAMISDEPLGLAELRMEAHWSDDPERTWAVGRWPDMEAFAAWREAL